LSDRPDGGWYAYPSLMNAECHSG